MNEHEARFVVPSFAKPAKLGQPRSRWRLAKDRSASTARAVRYVMNEHEARFVVPSFAKPAKLGQPQSGWRLAETQHPNWAGGTPALLCLQALFERFYFLV